MGCTGILTVSPLAAQRQVAAQGPEIHQSRAAADLFTRPVTIQVTNVSLAHAIDALAASAGIFIQYNARILEKYPRPVSVRMQHVPLQIALDRVLGGTGLHTIPDGTTQLSVVETPVSVVQGVVVGRVVDSKTKHPVSGATVWVGDEQKGVVTGTDGTFRLSVPVGEHRLRLRALGYVQHTRTVTVAENETVAITFALDRTMSVLDEVVVTGTVIETERKALTTPVTVIKAEDIERRGITRIDELFRGEVPGLLAIEVGTNRYSNLAVDGAASAKVYSRGTSSLGGAANPIKTYIDGVELLDPAYLGTIDPKSIDRIEIITGPQAATIYGSGAMGGVMQIFTKKGTGSGNLEGTLSLKYGMLENNFSRGKTPSHLHGVTINGGSGPEFSYSGNFSYNYTGQWQPALFNSGYGAAVGINHVRDRMILNGSVSTMRSKSGTWDGNVGNYASLEKFTSGEYEANDYPLWYTSQQVSHTNSMTVAFGADYRVSPAWQHHLTLGKSQNAFALTPRAPRFAGMEGGVGGDTLFSIRSSRGDRTTMGYNTTLIGSPVRNVASALTVGINGSAGDQVSISGCSIGSVASVVVDCGGWPYPARTVNGASPDESFGGFGSWRLGLFGRLHLTLGLRAERNRAYGQEHKIDWTPTNGAAFTTEVGELTVKVLGSYGRATRAPQEAWRNQVVVNDPIFEPSQRLQQLSAPKLTPEYSRGPQGGVEVYYGNRGSVTVNYFRQTVSDLIQLVRADSVMITQVGTIYTQYMGVFQYQNVGTMRQFGWEGTASLNIAALTVKGTWSWNDSRVTYADPSNMNGVNSVGGLFNHLPTHFGNISASYAKGKTSIAVSTNVVGSFTSSISASRNGYDHLYDRERMYTERRRMPSPAPAKSWSGYAKSNIAVYQRVRDFVSLTLNVSNAENNYGSEQGSASPSLGRQTLFGATVKF